MFPEASRHRDIASIDLGGYSDGRLEDGFSKEPPDAVRSRRHISWEKYICSKYHNQGKAKCRYHSIERGPILTFLLKKLRDDILEGGQLDTPKGRFRERLEVQHQVDPSHVDALRSKVTELDLDISRGAKRLLRVPDNAVDEVA